MTEPGETLDEATYWQIHTLAKAASYVSQLAFRRLDGPTDHLANAIAELKAVLDNLGDVG